MRNCCFETHDTWRSSKPMANRGRRPQETCRSRTIQGIGVFCFAGFTCALLFMGTGRLGGQNSASSDQSSAGTIWSPKELATPLARDPIFVYNDWSAYDELSDNIPLTEELAMKELDEIVRLRRFGAHFDYYMMDAFWFDPGGGYRTWRKPNWPNGPDLIRRSMPVIPCGPGTRQQRPWRARPSAPS